MTLELWNTICQTVLCVVAIGSLYGLWRYVVWTKQLAIISQESVQASEKMVAEMRSARISESLPYVGVFIDIPPDSLVFIVLKNFGKTPAKNIDVSVEPPLFVKIGDATEQLPFVEKSVLTLAPGMEIRTGIGAGYQVIGHPDYPQTYTFTLWWDSDLHQDRQTATYELNLEVFAKVRMGGGGPEHEVSRSLKSISESLRECSLKNTGTTSNEVTAPKKKSKLIHKERLSRRNGSNTDLR